MTSVPDVSLLGWICAAALTMLLVRRRSAAIARGEHLARVAHELRGPLHAAGLVLCSARRHAPGGECARALMALEIELGRAALAVGDLPLDGQVPPRRIPLTTARGLPVCDVAALITELSAGWEAMAATDGRRVHVSVPSTPIWAHAERLRLAQALGNLIANALEHGAGPVSVAVRVSEPDQVQIEVCDDGPGLPAPVTTLSARPADPARRRGRGLGIAATVATDAGGRLSAAPAARGARLLLQLPAPAAPALVATRRPVIGAGGPSKPLAS